MLERETGIEPATNSLEGCDSTTELLPHTVTRSISDTCAASSLRHVRRQRSRLQALTRCPAQPRRAPTARARRLVARGGFEPPKPLGRQIYSLLRLTAPQPRQITALRPQPTPLASPLRANSFNCCVDPVEPRRRPVARDSRARYVELAKGFEPPTR